MQIERVYIETQMANLRVQIASSSIPAEHKENLLFRLAGLDIAQLKALCAMPEKSISPTNFRYILLFLINADVQDIAVLFHVEMASVYTVRYRIRKLFPQQIILPF